MNVYLVVSAGESFRIETDSLESAYGIFKTSFPFSPVDSVDLAEQTASLTKSIFADDTLTVTTTVSLKPVAVSPKPLA